ncbi:hypothetical protein [Pelagicoccus mobilis]|uniref:Uncharacterized protein n=1 Tax=Pelagicoccus mobilis TaxID=415221 RepID=A0A934VQZ5_9BACT|nr:hypothetical protein [Pelagicoccus mobilis]MBK1877088.1 hypothetical protein [Pelagicoccus mobilis]
MQNMKDEMLEFEFNGMPVGYFEESSFPYSDGIYKYMPYRGSGHYELGQELKKGKNAHCSYNDGGKKVGFEVVEHVEYGTLKLCQFKDE